MSAQEAKTSEDLFDPITNPDVGFIPVNNIVTVNQSPIPQGSHYAPLTQNDEGNIVDQASEINLNLPGEKEIEGFSLDGLFEFNTFASEETKNNFEKILKLFEQENGRKPVFLITPKFDPTGMTPFNIYFEEELGSWVKQKQKDDEFFLSRALPSTKDPFLRNLLSQVVNPNNRLGTVRESWQSTGNYSASELRELAQNYKTRISAYFNSEESSKDMSERVRIHELMHYVHTESLFYGAGKDLVVPIAHIMNLLQEQIMNRFRELPTSDSEEDFYARMREARMTCIKDEELRNALFNIRDTYQQLNGLDEAYSILHEIYSTTNLDSDKVQPNSDIFAARLAVILSSMKRSESSKLSAFEADMKSMMQEGKAMEEHMLGTLILLMKGKILSDDKDGLYEWNIDGEKLSVNQIIELIVNYDKNSDDFFSSFDPIKLKQNLETKMRHGLVIILNNLLALADNSSEEKTNLIPKEVNLDLDYLEKIQRKLMPLEAQA